MPRGKLRPTLEEVKALLAEDRDFLRPLVQTVLQELLEAEMTEALGKGERTPARLGYRAGYYPRTLITRVGKLELWVPQDRAGRFSTELFARYQRSEKALVAALAEMYVQGASTQAITEELCGHSFSAAAVSAINARLDEELAWFARRRLEEACPYLMVDARYERVREAGVIRSQAVLLAIGINWDGRCSILAVELAYRESRSSWREFLLGLRARALRRRVRGVRRPFWAQAGDRRGPARGGLAALFRALPQERPRLRATITVRDSRLSEKAGPATRPDYRI